MTLVSSEVLLWSKVPGVLQRGDRHEDIETLQELLNQTGFDCGNPDGIWGGKTDGGFDGYQRVRALVRDGVLGPKSRRDLRAAFDYGYTCGDAYPFPHDEQSAPFVWGGFHPTLGDLPSVYGRMSTFGGPDDKGDRIYGQALVPMPSSEAHSAAALYRRHPDLVALGLFRENIQDPLPRVSGPGGRVRTAGISWILNPDSYYVAMRWRRSGRPKPATHRVMLVHGDKCCICAPTDWGPAVSTGRSVDISPGAADALLMGEEDGLLLATDSRIRVLWASDNAPLGRVRL